MIGEILLSKYRVTKKIGEGTYSTVYEAQHIFKLSKVAVKFDYDETSKRLIENEINNYIYLQKNNMSEIAGIKSFGKLEDRNFIIMKKLDTSLDKYYEFHYFSESVEKMKISNLKITGMLIKLIENFHKLNLIHRDIKPENFMFDSNKSLCIIDMGMSKKYDSTAKSSTFIGNKLFSSYNTHLSEYIYSPKDDIISIFFMMFFLISDGDLPWKNICLLKTKIEGNIYYNLKKYTDFKKYYKNNGNYELLEPILKLYEIVEYNTPVDSFCNYVYLKNTIKKLIDGLVGCI